MFPVDIRRNELTHGSSFTRNCDTIKPSFLRPLYKWTGDSTVTTRVHPWMIFADYKIAPTIILNYPVIRVSSNKKTAKESGTDKNNVLKHILVSLRTNINLHLPAWL